jgi:hypothetical protein
MDWNFVFCFFDVKRKTSDIRAKTQPGQGGIEH